MEDETEIREEWWEIRAERVTKTQIFTSTLTGLTGLQKVRQLGP